MREKLKALSGRRLRFTARVGRRRRSLTRAGNPIPSILLEDIRHQGEVVSDHVWVRDGYWNKGLKKGDLITLQAGVGSYLSKANRKGHREYRLDNVWLIDVHRA